MSKYIHRMVPAAALLILFTLAFSAGAQRPNGSGQNSIQNITGSWRDERGRVALIRQVGSDVCWYMGANPDTQVFCGVMDGSNTITGQWMDMPGSRQMTNGQLTVRVQNNNRIVKVRSTSRYDSSTWSRDDSRDYRDTRYSTSNTNVAPPDQSWEQLPSTGRDIGVGNNGSVWLIGSDRVAGGFSIFNRSSSSRNNQWTRVEGGAVRIDVDGAGNPWIVNSEGVVYRRSGNQWQQLPGIASDIGVGAQGDAWIVGTNPVPGGFGIYHWNGREWAPVEGGAVRIDVDGNGNPWIVNSDGVLFRRVRNQWQQLPGSGRDISVNGAGDVWVVGTDPATGGYGIHHWTGREWENIPGGATQISVGSGGAVYIVNSGEAIYRRL